MPLKSLDLAVCLELTGHPKPGQYTDLASAVELSPSEANAAVRRLKQAGLLSSTSPAVRDARPQLRALLEFIEHGVRYAFFVVPGSVTRGVPTAHSAPPLNALIQSHQDSSLVWPDPEGTTRGQAIEPLLRSAPRIAHRNPRLYQLLALVDSIRCGTVRERALAIQEIRKQLADE
jgi:hypothetical protein